MIEKDASLLDTRSKAPSSQRKRQLIREGVVLLGYFLLTVAVTYPLIQHLQGDWLALKDQDTYVKIWDIWHFDRVVQGLDRPFHTSRLFYPSGLDLSYHSFSWLAMAIGWAISKVTAGDLVTGYNLSVFAGIFLTAYSGYLLARHLTGSRSAAWLAGAIYSFAPYHILHSGGHPDLIYLFFIPVCALLTLQAINELSIRKAVVAGIVFGLNAYCSLYILGLAAITLSVLCIYLVFTSPRDSLRSFEYTVLTVGAVGAIIALPIWLPAASSFRELTYAIESKYAGGQIAMDVLNLFIPHHNPILRSLLGIQFSARWAAYLGLVPLALTGALLASAPKRRAAAVWLVAGSVFVVLSLGHQLLINGHTYRFPMPGWLISGIPLIRIFRRSDFFVLGLLLPLAVCAAYGFQIIQSRFQASRTGRWMLAGLLTAVVMFEYWTGEFEGVFLHEILPEADRAAVQRLDGGIIDLPMDRQESKTYVYLQTIHEQPIIEGLASRTPADAYDYIKANPLLEAWRSSDPLPCDDDLPDTLRTAMVQLIDDGIAYVVIHQATIPDATTRLLYGFDTVTPYYRSEGLIIYRLADFAHPLPAACLSE